MILYIVLGVLGFIAYKYVAIPYMARRYYQKLGVPVSESFIPFMGDLYHQIKTGVNDALLRDLYVGIYSKNPELGMIHATLPLSVSEIDIGDPELAQEVYQRMGESVDKSKILTWLAGRSFLKAFINYTTNQETKNRRKAYQPAFTYQNLKHYANIFKQCCEEFIVKYKNAKEEEIDISAEMLHITLDIIGRSAFGNKLSLAEIYMLKNGEEVKMRFQDAICHVLGGGFSVVLNHPHLAIFPILQKLNFPRQNKEINVNTRRIHEFCLKIIKDREPEWITEGKPQLTLIDMLLSHKESGLLTYEDMISDALMFIFAGHETTARALTSLLYRIHQHPEMVEKVRKEISEVMFDGDKEPNLSKIGDNLSYDIVQDLPYITNCLKETLRIDGPATTLLYLVTKPFMLKNIPISKGMYCTPSAMLLHNNPYQWHTPREFIPERFDSESKFYKTPSGERRHPMSYSPFAAGPRNCIGQNFAMLEAKIIAVYLIANFNFETVGPPKDKKDMSFGIGTQESLHMKITKRHNL